MNTDNIVVYESFIDPIKANVVKGLLDSYGIECFLSDENMVTLNAMYSQAIGGVKLNVFEKDIDRINTLLKAENIDPETCSKGEKEDVGTVCPKCNSSNVAFGGSVKQKFGLSNVLIFSFITSLFLMVYPFKMRKVYRCFNCDHEFKKA
jgi:hypothetical protein